MRFPSNKGLTVFGLGVLGVFGALAACCSGSALPDLSVDGGTTGSPALGGHTLLTQDQGQGTSPATTAPITTQARASTVFALSMGFNRNFLTPTDSFDNRWSLIGEQNPYAGDQFYTAMWSVVGAKGGSGHRLSVTKPGDPVDEISLAFVEVANGSAIKNAVYAYPQAGSPITPGTVTTDGPATLIAVWGGDGPGLSNTAVPSDGFQVIDSYLALGPSSGVQVAIAFKQVSAAGTYSLTWTATPVQGAACYLIAVE